MSAFLGQLGQKLAERWLTLLVLPGVLYLAAAASAHALGQTHLTSTSRISVQISTWSRSPTATTTAGQVLVLAGILAAAAAAGLAAQGLGAGIERLALAADWHTWPIPLRNLAAWRTAVRQRRWGAAHQEYSRLYHAAAPAGAVTTAQDREHRHVAQRTRDRIAAEHPQRPTWSGDRIHTAATRLKRDRHLDLGLLWPHLWLTMPDAVRTQILDARQALARANTLAAWAVLYAALALWWWPALILAILLVSIARHRIRDAADTYATLLEAAVRVHAGELVQTLGIEGTDPASIQAGDKLMSLLRSTVPVAALVNKPAPAIGAPMAGTGRD